MKSYKIRYQNKEIIVNNYILCQTILSKMRGLMFRSKNFKTPLVFTFNKPTRTPIHSLFVRTHFLAVWMRNDKIIEIKLIKPYSFNIKPKEKFDTLIEIPVEKPVEK